eukprot:4957816-Prymnesium_polylepis.1
MLPPPGASLRNARGAQMHARRTSSTHTGKYTIGIACSTPMKKRTTSSIPVPAEAPKSAVAHVLRMSVACVARSGDI